MSIQINSATAAKIAVASPVNAQPRQSDLSALSNAITAGDLSEAQKLLTSLSAAANSTNINSALSLLAYAIESGNIAAAQNALATLRSTNSLPLDG